MAIETLTSTYTSQNEMERLLSADGVSLRADDDGDGINESNANPGGAIVTVIQDAIDDATEKIDEYLADIYYESAMAESLWIRRRAAVLGCYALSMRRGNPPLFAGKVVEIIADLEAIRLGKRRVPRLATREDFTPGISQPRVDDRFMIRKIRIDEQISTGGRPNRRDRAVTYYSNEVIWP